MTKFRIAYSGWTTVEIEAETAEEAVNKFWDDGYNDLNDAVIDAEPEPVEEEGEPCQHLHFTDAKDGSICVDCGAPDLR